ncbi:transporter substrate-binding domain-containing protein [Pseudoalteromonas sp. NBT06-2]|uniref:substrate-binding periplasmic protein n=1 Tax=Pseudoalteromonas sp. NBT06-2 TaxID=2025950 RepID=UPI001483C7BC|nr:transporter substrate-binding domain-containing protein [Pseudoalteromonas sp. NBT06-2]
MAEALPPWNYIENGTPTGITVEVVREILKKINHPDTIVIYPWARAYRMTKDGSNNILFSMARTPEREPLFNWVGPIATEVVYFYKNKDKKLHIESLDDAKKTSMILITRGFPEQKYLLSKGFNNLFITLKTLNSLQMLARHKVDLIVSGDFTVKHFINKKKIEGTLIERVNIELLKFDLYIALSKNIPSNEVLKWQNALDQLKASGKYNEILKKYIGDSVN